MTNNVNDLSVRLSQAGILLNEPTSPAQLQTPWFVRALQAFSGWLAALFLLGFIAMGVVFVVESPAASMGLGLAMIGAAYGLFRRARSDVLEHLALAISLAGQLLVAWALVAWWEASPDSLWALLGWSLFGLQCVLALIMPSQVHRGFSAFAASLALYMALATSAMAAVASGLVLLAITLLWLNEFRWPGRFKDVQAWGYGLPLGLLVIQWLAHSGQALPLLNDMTDSAWAGLTPWLSVALLALALLLVFLSVFQRFSSSRGRWAAYPCAAALLIVSFYVPSVGQGVVVMSLGFAIGHRVLVGAGVLSLLLGIGSYYYWLESTLLLKSLTLLVIGGLLLLLRWALRQWLSTPVATPDDGSLDHDAER
ncbi:MULTISPECIES: DUF4401 domain-containing protein [Halomonadaceae]|mgnify:FL=1|uniref:DUF4401 domain-containing protein n=1 Tax=Halomonadaceae TaxID=28256 RepID=UPI000C322505|nr:DUF4401 domain-containing protein [Halomonas sp. MES3-P3E]PKG47319.1 DUF4401 domain-containing protein [Halomonas sp. MES3-P3E]